ncbi:unnamed protein product [Owenia fusiformis]|uniref:3-hydroxyacyl-CoA dehydrogenase n=1 Tax=Owenia fusiformis TaxID=6347 RepID=A0A8J1UFQ6_OWEFU|nr:unnamed protein product [Owenia fusiformis]
MAFSPRKIGIIGSGLIGRSWAMIFASADYKVVVYDNSAAQLSNAKEEIDKQLHGLSEQNLLRGDIPVQKQIENIEFTTNFDACTKGAKYIQECIPELIDLKRKIFNDLDNVMSDESIVGSSTSAIPSSRFTNGLKHKSRMLVVHPTNPPYYVPLTELVPAPWTDSDVVDEVYRLMQEIRQVPVKLTKEVYGFVLPRVHHAVLMESWKMVQDGIISIEDVDKVMSDGLGTRYAFMGPLETRHLNFKGGFKDGCKPHVWEVSNDSGPNARLEGPLLEIIQEDFNKRIPLETLAERRAWRDTRIAALSKFKRDMSNCDNNA